MQLARGSRQLIGAAAALSKAQGAARAVAGAAGRGEVLHNSLSDGFYQVPNKQQGDSTERVCSQPPQPRPRNVRQAMDSMTDPRYLKDSLSEGLYDYRPRYRANSMSEPMPGWLQNSLSDAHYEMPHSLRAAATLKPGQGFATARSIGQTMHRVVAMRSSLHEPDPLHNSYSHGDYTPRKR